MLWSCLATHLLTSIQIFRFPNVTQINLHSRKYCGQLWWLICAISSFRYGAFVMSPQNNEKTKWHKSATIVNRFWSVQVTNSDDINLEINPPFLMYFVKQPFVIGKSLVSLPLINKLAKLFFLKSAKTECYYKCICTCNQTCVLTCVLTILIINFPFSCILYILSCKLYKTLPYGLL